MQDLTIGVGLKTRKMRSATNLWSPRGECVRCRCYGHYFFVVMLVG